MALIYSKEYILKLKNRGLSKTEERRIYFPLNDDLIKREELICAGTTQAALLAFENGVSFNVAGGVITDSQF